MKCLLAIAVSFFILNHTCGNTEKTPGNKKGLVNRFYQKIGNKLFWFTSVPDATELRTALKILIDSADLKGLNKHDYLYDQVAVLVSKSYSQLDSAAAMQADKIFSEAALNYSHDLLAGKDISKWIKADQLTGKVDESDQELLCAGLSAANNPNKLEAFFHSLEPSLPDYSALMYSLNAAIAAQDRSKIKSIEVSVNIFRWINHFHFRDYIVVNIPAAQMTYHYGDSILVSKAIVGKPSLRTPRFTAYCSDIILYPYWNVPRKIAVTELLPDFKRNPGLVDEMNMQIINSSGNVVDPATIRWSEMNAQNFPYRVRQSTGCDNALGVIKFNLTSPFDVYMHDTNLKSAFKRTSRFLSHGCIRLEKAAELARLLLPNEIDESYLASCLKKEKPTMMKTKHPVPVFVVYMPAQADEKGQVTIYRDVYHLL